MIPDQIEPFVGWRAFRYLHDRGMLRSIVDYNFSLPPWESVNSPEALCRHPPMAFQNPNYRNHVEDIPVADCACGFYSVKELSDLPNALWIPASRMFKSYILGEVDVYGKVVKGSNGYRSSHQRIRRLVVHKIFLSNSLLPETIFDLPVERIDTLTMVETEVWPLISSG